MTRNLKEKDVQLEKQGNNGKPIAIIKMKYRIWL